MACTPRPRRALVLLLLAACTGGEDDTGDGSTASPPVTVASTTTTAVPTTGDDTTGDPGTTTTGDQPGTSTTTGDESSTSSTSSSTSETTDTTGAICDPGQPNCVCDGTDCIDGYVCSAGVCTEAMVCNGDVEAPGEAEDAPTLLADISDNDDDYHSVQGILSGALDVDWYRYHGADTLGYVAEPTLEVVSLTPGARVCQFVECDNGGVAQTQLECPVGTKFAISGDLRPGCCHTTGFKIDDLDCNTNDESVKIWVRLDKPTEDTCTAYDLRIHF